MTLRVSHLIFLFQRRNKFSKHNDFTVKTNPGFRYEGKIGEERDLVIFNSLPPNNAVRKQKKKYF